MSVRASVVVALVWLASLVGVGVWAQTAPEQRVISGGDLGFRVERVQSDGTPVGKLVVRTNGKWVETGFSVGVSRADTK
jgi:hypothetical protein